MNKTLRFFHFLFTAALLFCLFVPLAVAAEFTLVIRGELDINRSDNRLEAFFVSPDQSSETNVTVNVNTTWKSSNTQMAAIFQNGDVVFSGETGSVDFTVEYQAGGRTYTATRSFRFEPAESRVYNLVIKGELDPKGTANTLSLVRRYTDGREETIDKQFVTWESSDKLVATVDRDGKVTFTGEAGQVTITARHRGLFATTTATYPTEVKNLVINESLFFTEAFFTSPPRLTVTAFLNNGTSLRIPNPTWTSSNPEVATIDSRGFMTLTGKAGTTVITAASDGRTVAQSLTVPEEKAITLRNLFFTENLFYSPGGQSLKVSALFDNNSIRDVSGEATFISGNTNLGQIYGNTLFYSGLSGNLTVTARYENQTATVQTFIYPSTNPGGTLTGIKFEKSVYNIADNNQPLVVYGIYSDNRKVRLTSPTYNIFQKNIAEVRNGNLLLKGIPGTANLEATYGRFRDQATIYNFRPEGNLRPERIYIISSLQTGAKRIPLVAVARFSDGRLLDIADQAVWNVSNTNHARILPSGELEILENKDFTVTAFYEGLTATIGSRAFLFPNFTNGLNTAIVPINRIYENTRRMQSANPFLPYPPDIGGHWAERILRNGQMVGWIKGFPDGTLRPDQRITRGEFAAFMDRIFDLSAPTDQFFSDTAGHWAQPSISKIKALNIYPMNNPTFRPNDPLTREEMAEFMARLSSLRNTSNNPFVDVDASNPYLSSILKMNQGGVMVGMDANRFAPRETATRAQALTVINNLLKTDVNLASILP